jgi:UPF0271 protein
MTTRAGAGAPTTLSFGINCDIGESYGLFKIGDDEGVMPFITTANVACGFHGGDPTIMRRTIRLAKEHGVRCGAHPSLPDLQGFGRREMNLVADELTDMIIYQIGALKAMLEAEGLGLNHVKPHGVLYSMLWRREYAEAFADAVEAIDPGMPWIMAEGTVTHDVALRRGLVAVTEFTADRDYDREGRIVIVRVPEPMNPQKAVDRVAQVMSEGMMPTVDGSPVRMSGDAVCIHSDTPGAAKVAEALSAYLRQQAPAAGS